MVKISSSNNLCLCGCGGTVKTNKALYCIGHHMRRPEKVELMRQRVSRMSANINKNSYIKATQTKIKNGTSKHSEATKLKIGLANKGKCKTLSTEQRKKQSDMARKMFLENNPMKSDISRKKISDHMKVNNPMNNKATRDKMALSKSGKISPFRGRKHTEKTCVKMSKSKIARMKSGENISYKLRGHYLVSRLNCLFGYRSFYELQFLKSLENRNDIVKCDYEGLRIPYLDRNLEQHICIPDFVLTYSNGTKEIIEITDQHYLDSDINKKLKVIYTNDYARDHGMNFALLLKNDLFSSETELKDLMKVGYTSDSI